MNISNKIVSSFLEPVGFSANYLLVNNKKALHFAVNLPFILFLLLMLIGQIVMVSHLKDENGLYLYDSKYWEMARKIPLVPVGSWLVMQRRRFLNCFVVSVVA